jgi:hypothetical protein
VASASQRYEPNTADLALERLDWSKLSLDAQWTARTLASAFSYGFSRAEVARIYGKSPYWVSTRMANLRREIPRAGRDRMMGATLGPPDPPR